MTENDIAKQVVDVCYSIHVHLGPGLFESVYEAVLAKELDERGMRVRRQVPIAVRYKDMVFEEGFRADLIVEDKVIIELKSVEQLTNVHKKQLQTYLRLSGIRLGLLVNFGAALMKDGLKRIVNGLQE